MSSYLLSSTFTHEDKLSLPWASSHQGLSLAACTSQEEELEDLWQLPAEPDGREKPAVWFPCCFLRWDADAMNGPGHTYT